MVWIVFVIYLLAALVLAAFGLNYFLMTWLYGRRPPAPSTPPLSSPLPRVTVQLPIYDELYVVERVIDAAAALDWPRNRLQIQVLDDSDDETSAIAARRIEHLQHLGYEISHIRRSDRSGFKAGALAEGLCRATGEFIAIFDADFVPPANFLKQTIPHFTGRPDLGVIQTRWGHLNAGYSPLTRAQAIALDGHFVIEQGARWGNGLYMNFNGTAGVWRRESIESAGGWKDNSLTEDLDLSYRAQLAGWKFLYLPDIVCLAELPAQLHAFKRQQFRWAKGSTQCLVKLGPRVLASRQLGVFPKYQALLHLGGYVMNPLMVILLLTSVPLLAAGVHFPDALMILTVSTVGPILFYAISQHALYPDWVTRLRQLPVLMLLGTGLALSNSLAVFEALTGRENSFRRTPKFRLERGVDTWGEKRYRLSLGSEVLGEAALALYAMIGAAAAFHNGSFWAAPIMLLYAGGFAFTVGLSLWHSRPSPQGQVGWLRVSE